MSDIDKYGGNTEHFETTSDTAGTYALDPSTVDTTHGVIERPTQHLPMTDGHPWATCPECGSSEVTVWADYDRQVHLKCGNCGTEAENDVGN